MKPQIGILASEDDLHAQVIQHRIEGRHGLTCHHIPGRQLAMTGKLTWDGLAEGTSVLPTTRGSSVNPASLNALWIRRIPMSQDIPPAADPAYAAHINSECHTALMGLLLNEFRGRWVSHPEDTDRADNKLVQLRAARAVGLHVPRTLVSQDPVRIRSFVAAEGAAILKAVRPRGEVAETAMVSQALLADDEVLSLAPTIYQECIHGSSHLRILMLGGTCHATRIDAERLDWRLDLNVPFRQVSLATEIVAKLSALLERLGLMMGVIDMKIDENGNPVFLEVNPQGQFLFVEGLAGQPLADAVADFLVEQAIDDARRGVPRLVTSEMQGAPGAGTF